MTKYKKGLFVAFLTCMVLGVKAQDDCNGSIDTAIYDKIIVYQNDKYSGYKTYYPYSKYGFEEDEPGTYTQTFTSVNGCDSVVTLILEDRNYDFAEVNYQGDTLYFNYIGYNGYYYDYDESPEQTEYCVVTANDPCTWGYSAWLKDMPENNYSNLSSSVIIPSQITHNGKTYTVIGIGGEAFAGCTNLTEINLPSTIKSIGRNAFYGCSNLQSIDIPQNVTYIALYYEDFLFGDDFNWNNFGIFFGNAFYGCNNLKEINVHENNTVYSSVNGFLCNKAGNTILYCPYNHTGAIPDNITTIGKGAFAHGNTGATIGDNVTTVEDFAFYNNKGIVVLGKSMISTGNAAFAAVDGLVSFPQDCNIKTINQYAFYGSVIDGNIPASVEKIEDYAFAGILKYPFNPPISDQPQSTITINSDCEIGEYVFSNVAFIDCKTATPPTIKSNSFSSATSNVGWTGGQDFTVFVPCQALNNYKTATNWNSFTNYVELCDTTVYMELCNNENLIVCNDPDLIVISNKNTGQYYNCGDTLKAGEHNMIIKYTGNKTDSYGNAVTYTRQATFSLSFSDTVHTDINKIINYGDTVHFANKVYNSDGIYTDSLKTVNGCDSIVTLYLTTVSQNDTVIIHDTVTVIQYETITLHDTVTNTITLHDTIHSVDTITQILYDTVTLHDTVTNTVIQTDTVTITEIKTDTVTVFDTIIMTNTLYDTVTLHDTVTNTVIQTDTVTITEIKTDTVTLFDTIILTNTIYDTINSFDTVMITVYDTVFEQLTDTIYIYDTVIPCAEVRTYIYAEIHSGEIYSEYGFNESETGTYSQMLQTANGCDSIVTLYLQVTSAIDEIKQEKVINIYPNPAKDELTIRADGDVMIFNNKGQQVKEIKDIKGVKIISVKDLESGVYYVRVGNRTKKLIVK